MIKKIKLYILETQVAKYILINILISAILTIIAITIDWKIINISEYIPSLLKTKLDLGKSLLTTLSSSFLSVTTFTFSSILVVLTTYSSSYSPRVINNFLTNKITMKVLGIFVGGFIYSTITLYFIRESINIEIIAPTFAIIYSMVAIIYFIAFVYSVASSIQAENLIETLFNEAKSLIINKNKNRKNIIHNIEIFNKKYNSSFKVYPNVDGYLEMMDYKLIFKKIKNLDCLVIFDVIAGEFITKDNPIATVYYNILTNSKSEEIKKLIINKTSILNKRAISEDYRFANQKIVEIGLRALSPGINDPYTAIHSIKILSLLLKEMYTQFGDYCSIYNDKDIKIIYKDYELKNDLFITFSPLVLYGKDDLFVISALFEAINIIEQTANENNKELINEFRNYIYEKSKKAYSNELDLNYIKKVYQKRL